LHGHALFDLGNSGGEIYAKAKKIFIDAGEKAASISWVRAGTVSLPSAAGLI
jgi:hypothetical protein